MAAWTPGREPQPLPEGISMPWPAGADLILQLHLHPSGKPEVEQSSIGLYFTDEPPRRSMVDVLLIQKQIDIPPGEPAYRTRDELTLPADMRAFGIFPHMHLLGKEVKVTAQQPDGTVTPLLWIDDWDFNWQMFYQYASPVLLPKGTRLVMECVHDNSAGNVRNPNQPPRRVTWGEQTTDEMAAVVLQLMPQREADLAELGPLRPRIVGGVVAEGRSSAAPVAEPGRTKPADPAQQAAQALRKLDQDGDGHLDFQELLAAKVGDEEALKKHLLRFDSDGNGKLNASELAEALGKLTRQQ
jgi:hypothetical protein